MILYCFSPAIILRLLWRSIKAPDYRKRILERFAIYRSAINFDNKKQPILIHAVSVGEVIAVAPLVRKLLASYDSLPLVITTTTPTGSTQLIRLFANEVQQKKIMHLYLPYDFPDAIHRFLTMINPRMLVIVETELWPNLLTQCRKNAIPSVLLNARLSQKSARNYARIASLSRHMLACLDLVCAQTKQDGERFLTLGLSVDKLTITGNIKFDLTLSESMRLHAAGLKQQWSLLGARKILIAASTHQGEDEIVLAAYAQLLDQLNDHSGQVPPLLVIVPRHPERFDNVKQLAEKQFNTSAFSSADVNKTTQVVVVDEMGMLLMLYGVSDIALVAGSLVDRGGHNYLEPAAWGLPILSGQSVYNFQWVADNLLRVGALTFADNAQALSTIWQRILADEKLAQSMGEAARSFQLTNQGALAVMFEKIDALIQEPD